MLVHLTILTLSGTSSLNPRGHQARVWTLKGCQLSEVYQSIPSFHLLHCAWRLHSPTMQIKLALGLPSHMEICLSCSTPNFGIAKCAMGRLQCLMVVTIVQCMVALKDHRRCLQMEQLPRIIDCITGECLQCKK